MRGDANAQSRAPIVPARTVRCSAADMMGEENEQEYDVGDERRRAREKAWLTCRSNAARARVGILARMADEAARASGHAREAGCSAPDCSRGKYK